MTDHIIIISKDATLPQYLGAYGGIYWKTPNIDELAAKGTIFMRHYAVAPSTAMSFIGMFTGKLPLQTEHSDYVEPERAEDNTIFDKMHELGYSCHLMWSENYKYMAEKYSKCYGKHTTHHEHKKFNQSVGPHKKFLTDKLEENDSLAEATLCSIIDEINAIDFSKKVFMWLHLPHVLLGRCGYGQDIDLFDRLVGEIRKVFPDEGIYVTADHGHMNGIKEKTCYGFDVYEPAIHIPMISPKIQGYDKIDFPTSNKQLYDIIIKENIPCEKFIVSDSAYYAQPFRKIAIISGDYKYIYNKKNGTEELYDLLWDPNENDNLLVKYIYDFDRHRKVVKEQVVFYPYHNRAIEAYESIKQYFEKIWRTGTPGQEIYNKLAVHYRRVRAVYRNVKQDIKGRFERL